MQTAGWTLGTKSSPDRAAPLQIWPVYYPVNQLTAISQHCSHPYNRKHHSPHTLLTPPRRHFVRCSPHYACRSPCVPLDRWHSRVWTKRRRLGSSLRSSGYSWWPMPVLAQTSAARLGPSANLLRSCCRKGFCSTGTGYYKERTEMNIIQNSGTLGARVQTESPVRRRIEMGGKMSRDLSTGQSGSWDSMRYDESMIGSKNETALYKSNDAEQYRGEKGHQKVRKC